jgi:transcriptional regulator with XRE-family HTH domain
MVDPGMISPQQCQVARTLLGWSQAELAARANVSDATLSRFEREGKVDLIAAIAIRHVMEGAKVEFFQHADGTSGVRLGQGTCSNDGSDGREVN